MKETWFGIMWAAPENVWALSIVLIVSGLIVWRLIRLRSVCDALTSGRRRNYLLRQFSFSREIAKAILLIISIVALFLALLRPVSPKEDAHVSQRGRDLFIALDISRSMLAGDRKPHRLQFAKDKIKRLVSQMGSERVGLILFSGSALVQCPLTADYSSFFMFLDQVDAETISSGTTAMDKAIGKAIDAFSSTPDRKTKLLVLFTDGEDFSSNLSGVKQKAQRVDLHIFTCGVGTSEGAPIPLFDHMGRQQGHQLDRRGKVVISRLNEGILTTLAQDSGGVYLPVTSDETDIRHLIDQIESFEKDTFEDKKLEQFDEYYQYPLVVAFCLLAISWII